jgi:hypothetical protein
MRVESLGKKEKVVMIKIITGRVGNKKIEEPIEPFQAHIVEQITTAKRNIIRKFESLGYTEKDVTFDE